jgi:endonuclease III
VAKQPFNINVVMRRIAKAVEALPKAAMFELAEQGHSSLFEQLVACIISIRTLEQVTIPAAKRLFEVARTPSQVAAMTFEKIDALIHPCTFHDRKAAQIQVIAQRILDEFNGELPCDREALLSFAGVGPKCAGLALGIACGQPHIGVDIHVHRVTNRWGYVQARTPEKTMDALAAKLPEKHWVEINRVLVPFGKYVCTGNKPKCSTCPVLSMCRQVGVTEHR